MQGLYFVADDGLARKLPNDPFFVSDLMAYYSTKSALPTDAGDVTVLSSLPKKIAKRPGRSLEDLVPIGAPTLLDSGHREFGNHDDYGYSSRIHIGRTGIGQDITQAIFSKGIFDGDDHLLLPSMGFEFLSEHDCRSDEKIWRLPRLLIPFSDGKAFYSAGYNIPEGSFHIYFSCFEDETHIPARNLIMLEGPEAITSRADNASTMQASRWIADWFSNAISDKTIPRSNIFSLLDEAPLAYRILGILPDYLRFSRSQVESKYSATLDEIRSACNELNMQKSNDSILGLRKFLLFKEFERRVEEGCSYIVGSISGDNETLHLPYVKVGLRQDTYQTTQ